VKVIYILPYSSLVTGREFDVDLFGFGYHSKTAQQVWRRTKKYQLECWRPERKLKEAISGEKDGIIYRAFPSFRLTLGLLDRFVYKGVTKFIPQARWGLWREYSVSLMRELKKECHDGEVLIHLLQVPFDLSYLICLHFSDVPIVGTHIGGAPYTFAFSSFVYNFPLSFLERKALSNIDILLTSSTQISESFSKLNSHVIISPGTLATDFNKLKPLEKEQVRSTLGIPLNKRVLLHVGRFDSAKGLDVILKTYRKLRSRYDLELILIGGLRSDPLYGEAVKSGARVHEWLPQHELIPYYSAADVYLFTRFYHSIAQERLEEFMGPGIASIESLACGTPVVGTNLKHFLGDEDDLKGIGKIPVTPDDVVKCIVDVLEHPELYQNCREIAHKYYSWEVVTDQLVDIYDQLFEKYYGRA